MLRIYFIISMAFVSWAVSAQELPGIANDMNSREGFPNAVKELQFYDGVENPYRLNIENPLKFGEPEIANSEFDANRAKFNNALSRNSFVFNRNPYAFDFDGGGAFASWDTGFATAYSSHNTLPNLISKESAEFVVTQNWGNFSITAGANAGHYQIFKKLMTNYGFSGLVTYRVSDRFSLNAYGEYYATTSPFPYMSPAMLPYIGTKRFGAYADMQFGEHFGMELGAGREYDLYSRSWQTVPVVSPYLKFNNGKQFKIELGRLVGEVLDGWLNGGNYYNNHNPTIGPPIAPMPPVR